MSGEKHPLSASASPAPGPKRAKAGSTAVLMPSSHVKGVTFKFKLRQNDEGLDWVKDIVVLAFQTPSSQSDQLIIDIKLKKERKVLNADELMAKMRRDMGLAGTGDDDDEPEDDAEDDLEDPDELDDEYAEEEDEDDGHGVKLGVVWGRLIPRSFIRKNFWAAMEEPSQDTAALGFNIFDR